MYLYQPRTPSTGSETAVTLYERLSQLSAHGTEASRSYHEGVRKRRLERQALKARLKRLSSPQTSDAVNVFEDGDSYGDE